jgi:hypothetical protein
MIARSFKSVLWVATVGGAALGCYMVSLKVATERSDLAKVESRIVSAQRDIRALQTELGTRGRLAQLEEWNANVLALSAPSANQFLPDHLTLARLEQKAPTVEQRSGEVHLAALATGTAKAAPKAREATAETRGPAPAKLPKLIRAVQTANTAPPQPPLLRQASFSTGSTEVIRSPEPIRRAKLSQAGPVAGGAGTPRGVPTEKSGRERGAGTR